MDPPFVPSAVSIPAIVWAKDVAFRASSRALRKWTQRMRSATIKDLGADPVSSMSVSGGLGEDVDDYSFKLDGDEEMDTEENRRRRQELKADQYVIASIVQFWLVCSKQRDEHGQESINQDVYTNLHVRMQKVLDDSAFVLDDALRTAREDWLSDASRHAATEGVPGKTMTFLAFFDCMFEVADHWTPDIDAGLYAQFLHLLYLRCVEPGGGAWLSLDLVAHEGLLLDENVAQGCRFGPGSCIEALWSGNRRQSWERTRGWQAGTVLGYNAERDTYSIEFQDGTSAFDVFPDQIRRRPPFYIGCQVEAQLGDKDKTWRAAKLLAFQNEAGMYGVLLQDGSEALVPRGRIRPDHLILRPGMIVEVAQGQDRWSRAKVLAGPPPPSPEACSVEYIPKNQPKKMRTNSVTLKGPPNPRATSSAAEPAPVGAAPRVEHGVPRARIRKVRVRVTRDTAVAELKAIRRNPKRLGPLSLAAQCGEADLVRTFIALNENVNETDKNLSTPLIHCVWGNHIKIVEMLLGAGADVNQANMRKNTALHFAFERGHVVIGQLLLDAGAKFTKNCLGKTPHQLNKQMWSVLERRRSRAFRARAALENEEKLGGGIFETNGRGGVGGSRGGDGVDALFNMVEQREREARLAFEKFDKKKDGYIDVNEFRVLVRQLVDSDRLQEALGGDVAMAFVRADHNLDRRLDFAEFAEVLNHLRASTAFHPERIPVKKAQEKEEDVAEEVETQEKGDAVEVTVMAEDGKQSTLPMLPQQQQQQRAEEDGGGTKLVPKPPVVPASLPASFKRKGRKSVVANLLNVESVHTGAQEFECVRSLSLQHHQQPPLLAPTPPQSSANRLIRRRSRAGGEKHRRHRLGKRTSALDAMPQAMIEDAVASS